MALRIQYYGCCWWGAGRTVGTTISVPSRSTPVRVPHARPSSARASSSGFAAGSATLVLALPSTPLFKTWAQIVINANNMSIEHTLEQLSQQNTHRTHTHTHTVSHTHTHTHTYCSTQFVTAFAGIPSRWLLTSSCTIKALDITVQSITANRVPCLPAVIVSGASASCLHEGFVGSSEQRSLKPYSKTLSCADTTPRQLVSSVTTIMYYGP